jgi:tetratricopeptide (TPR) repeat protein
VLDGETLPATADPTRYVESIVPLEALGDTRTARAAYATALTRWPDNVVALFGLASTEYQLGRLIEAEQAYRRLLELSPDNAIVLNNLAQVMLDRGCAAQALVHADAAVLRLTPGSDAEAAIRDTRAQAAAAVVQNADTSRCD